ncbi:hypothetical protein V494_00871 [Pseudogymnoascus sp. VKM F-4513 (FW-928)]|nr:hypothetical protein V494_00871 [Pseudogymnoascus sp. VKM F-4513 (FW-928)]
MEECPLAEQRVLQLIVERREAYRRLQTARQYVKRMQARMSGRSIAPSALMKDFWNIATQLWCTYLVFWIDPVVVEEGMRRKVRDTLTLALFSCGVVWELAPLGLPYKMSDVEEEIPVVEVQDEVEVSGEAPKGQMSVLDALKGVLKLALMHDGLARGLREASKALDRRQAHMCVLNEACEEEAYKKLVVALCSEHKIPLIKVPDGKQLGEWAGLCVLDREGNARKVVNCSCVVVKDWGEESQERSILLNYFQTEQ